MDVCKNGSVWVMGTCVCAAGVREEGSINRLVSFGHATSSFKQGYTQSRYSDVELKYFPYSQTIQPHHNQGQFAYLMLDPPSVNMLAKEV